MSARTALVGAAALLSLAACAAPAGGDDHAATAPTTPELRAAAYADSGLVTRPALMDCLVRQQGLEVRTENVFYNDPSTLPGERLWISVVDHWEDWLQGGWFYVFADEATAAANAQAALAQDIAAEEAPETATAEQFGNVVWVRRLPLEAPPTEDEQKALSCLPGADPAAALVDLPAGTATPAATFDCIDAIGLEPDFEKTEDHDAVGGWGEIDAFYLDDSSQWVAVHLFQDAATAEAQRAAVTAEAEQRSIVAGNVIAVFDQPIDRTGPQTAAVLACLPSA